VVPERLWQRPDVSIGLHFWRLAKVNHDLPESYMVMSIMFGDDQIPHEAIGPSLEIKVWIRWLRYLDQLTDYSFGSDT
jgi:hypothetical protein